MASGQTLLVFNARSGVPPTSAFATLDARNNHTVLDFDAAVDESITFETLLPRNYAGGGITALLVWAASTATSGNVRWLGAFERHQDETTDLDSDSFATAQGVTAAAPTTNGAPQYSEIAFTNGAQIDSLAVGESLRFKVTREATNGVDTMVGDAELLRVELRET